MFTFQTFGELLLVFILQECYSRLYDLVILVELGFGFRFDFKVRFWYFVESFCCLGVRKVFLRSRIVVLQSKGGKGWVVLRRTYIMCKGVCIGVMGQDGRREKVLGNQLEMRQEEQLGFFYVELWVVFKQRGLVVQLFGF